MARVTLIVFDIIRLFDGSLAIVLRTFRKELASRWVNMSKGDLKALFEGKRIQVFGMDCQFEADVLGVEILNFIEDFKMVILKLDNNPSSQKIKIHDEVEVDL